PAVQYELSASSGFLLLDAFNVPPAVASTQITNGRAILPETGFHLVIGTAYRPVAANPYDFAALKAACSWAPPSGLTSAHRCGIHLPCRDMISLFHFRPKQAQYLALADTD